jgi:hypothetical protein
MTGGKWEHPQGVWRHSDYQSTNAGRLGAEPIVHVLGRSFLFFFIKIVSSKT